MNKKLDYLVFIGRMEPPHVGHIEVILHSLTLAEHVIVLVGSSNQPRKFKNPWKFQERKTMLQDSINHLDVDEKYRNRVSILPLRDKKYNDELWAEGVQNAVQMIVNVTWLDERKPEIGIIGHSKDETSYYLKMFPQWGEPIEHPLNEDISATEIRQLYFEGKNLKFLETLVPAGTYWFLQKFRESEEYQYVKSEYEHIKRTKKQWIVAPYPVNQVTVDAVVVQSGHVLLVRRSASPGRRLWALPGGYLMTTEKIQAGMLRELDEETRIKVPLKVLIGSIKKHHVFDAEDRSEVGRIITHAFYIQLEPGPLPKIKGGQDVDDGTDNAKWIPLSELDEEIVFDDHWHIVDYFVSGGDDD
jgi:bifunctional NMN adenylyltransferase/nudix hydrolase